MQFWENLKSYIRQLFSKSSIRSGQIYHIHEGTHRNKFIIIIDYNKESMSFLLLPEGKNINMNVDEFNLGLDRCIIALVERLPGSVRNICHKQYIENENTNNRRK
jgi:hypothetical protein